MRFSFTIVVLAVACMVAAVSAGIYSTKTGGSKGPGHSKGGSDAKKRPEDDRFHLQSSDGQYVFGHTTGTEGRAEIRDKDGTVTGYYSYVEEDGRVAYVNYVADEHGYRVLSNTGVPSASVTIEGHGDENSGSGDQKDFGKVFADFTKRIKDKIVERSGQKVVDPTSGDGQYPVDSIVFPTKETKQPKHGGSGQFPDWNQAKNAASPKPTTTVKGRDDDVQISTDNDWSAITTTETASNKYIPTNPNTPQVPTKGGNRIGGYSDIVISEGRDAEETITEIVNTRTGTESTVIDDTENSSPVTKHVSIVNNVQTTISYYDDDEPVKTTASGILRGDFQTTIAPGVKRFRESSTVLTIPERPTEHYLQTVIASDDEVVKKPHHEIPFGTEVVPTTGRPLYNGPSAAENVPVTDYQTTAASVDRWSDDGGVYTTTGPVDEYAATVTDAAAAPYGPRVTTLQPEIRVDDVAETSTTVAGVRRSDGVTERDEDSFDYRTIGPTERIGTTANPGQTEAQEQEIIWPEIPQEPVPQVLVPLDPYAEGARPKNAGVKTQPIESLPARHYDSVDGKSPAVNATTTTETTAPPSVNNDENATELFYPKYFFIG